MLPSMNFGAVELATSQPHYDYNFRLADDSDSDRFTTQLTGLTYVLDVNGKPTVGAITVEHQDALGIKMMVSIDRCKGHGRRMTIELGLARRLGKHFLCAENLDSDTEPIWIRLGFNMRQVQDDVIVRCKRI